jgi:hypothetical protein
MRLSRSHYLDSIFFLAFGGRVTPMNVPPKEF